MTTRLEDGPDDRDGRDGPGFAREGDDPLLVVLRPDAGFLGPPPGRYEAIRRTASRRRLLRAAAGAAATAAAAALIALPLHWAAPAPPASPAPPLAPAPAAPTPDASPSPAPSRDPARSPGPDPALPTEASPTTAATPSPSAPPASVPSASVPSVEPSDPPERQASPGAPGTVGPTPSVQGPAEQDGTAAAADTAATTGR